MGDILDIPSSNENEFTHFHFTPLVRFVEPFLLLLIIILYSNCYFIFFK